MCGIIGYITATPNLYKNEKERFMSAGLIIDTIRGQDSTGVFAVKEDKRSKRPNWIKKVAPGPSLVADARYDALFNNNGISKFRAMIGHNRKATYGAIDLKTAHPFQDGPITLVHNGTLDSTVGLPVSITDCHNDSHAIAKNLGVMDKKELIGKLRGAFALVWHDQRDHTINVVRNSQRPLHMAKAGNSETIYIASEAEMLFWLGRKIGLQLGRIVEPIAGRLLTFSPDSLIPKVTDCPLGVQTNLPRLTAPTTTAGHSWGGRNITSKAKEPQGIQVGDGTSPKVLLGSRRISVPDVLKLQLIDRGLTPMDLLEFIPKTAQEVKWPDRRVLQNLYTVRGYIRAPDAPDLDSLPAVIHGVPPTIWTRHGAHSWTARPVGVTYLTQSDPCLVLRILRYTGAPPVIQTPSAVKTELKPHKAPKKESCPIFNEIMEIEEKGMEYYNTHKKGKYGALVPKHVFDKDTAKGCVFCQDNIDFKDANRIEWVNNGVDPLCVDCTEVMHSEQKARTDTEEAISYMQCAVCDDYEQASNIRNRMCLNCQEDHMQYGVDGFKEAK